MICPACKTNNLEHENHEFCIQCGSDLHVHRLLRDIGEKVHMNNEITNTAQEQKKTSNVLVFFQIMPGITLFICAVFGIFVGMRFLMFIDQEQARPMSAMIKSDDLMSAGWLQTEFKQLQQMNAIIHEELNLILDQHQENQVLQKKVQQLTAQILSSQSHPINQSHQGMGASEENQKLSSANEISLITENITPPPQTSH